MGRSGTTVLGLALSMHREVGFLNEPKAAQSPALESFLLDKGYALAGSTFRGTGWQVKDGTADFRLVKVDRLDDRDAVLESGLTAGEIVVVDGQLRLAPGVKVEVRSDLGQAPGARS